MDVKHPELYRKLLRVYDSEMRKELDIATLVKTLETLKTVPQPPPPLPRPQPPLSHHGHLLHLYFHHYFRETRPKYLVCAESAFVALSCLSPSSSLRVLGIALASVDSNLIQMFYFSFLILPLLCWPYNLDMALLILYFSDLCEYCQ